MIRPEVRVMAYWRCPAGDFTATDEREKREHIKDMLRNRKHRDILAEKTKDRGKSLIKDIKNRATDFLDKFY